VNRIRTGQRAWGQVVGSAERPTLVLNGHIGVASERDATRWDFPPFGGKISGGRVHGRGASDMKGGLPPMMITARILGEMGDQLGGKLLVQFATREETGGADMLLMTLLLEKDRIWDYSQVRSSKRIVVRSNRS